MGNYIEVDDMEVRHPKKIAKILKKVEKYRRKDVLPVDVDAYYLGVEQALRWVICATPMEPLPEESL